MDIRQAKAIINEAVGHLLVLALSYVSAFAADHGLNLHIPAIPAAITATGLLAVARLAMRGLVKAWHSGKLEAELLADLKRFGGQVIADVENTATGN